MIALVDYGIGNLRSVEKALETVGADVRLTSDPDVILSAEQVVLPGVGAFGDGMAGLVARGLEAPIRSVIRQGVPFLGICVGMQLLFEESEELGRHIGLGILPGKTVAEIQTQALQYLTIAGTQGATITVAPDPITDLTEEVTVTVSVPMDQNTWVTPVFTPGATIQRSSTLRTERYRLVRCRISSIGAAI